LIKNISLISDHGYFVSGVGPSSTSHSGEQSLAGQRTCNFRQPEGNYCNFARGVECVVQAFAVMTTKSMHISRIIFTQNIDYFLRQFIVSSKLICCELKWINTAAVRLAAVSPKTC
jgi:hypothetical protein